MADHLACPRCGNRVDENPETHEPDTIPTVRKQVAGADWKRDAEFAYCPHCGAVLGVLPPRT